MVYPRVYQQPLAFRARLSPEGEVRVEVEGGKRIMAEPEGSVPREPQSRPATGGAREGSERVAWWRRMFGG